jgi:hypothetical protein
LGTTFLSEIFAGLFNCESTFWAMRIQMISQVVFLFEFSGTQITAKWSLAGMNSAMGKSMAALYRFIVAQRAKENLVMFPRQPGCNITLKSEIVHRLRNWHLRKKGKEKTN